MIKGMAFVQIVLMISFSFAVAFVIGGEVGVVGADIPVGYGSTTLPVSVGSETGSIISVGTKSVFIEGKGIYEGVNVMRGASGLHYANVKDVGAVVFKEGGWVATDVANLPVGTEVSGSLSQAAGGKTITGGLTKGIGDLFAGNLVEGFMGPVLGGLAWGAVVGGLAYGIAKLMGLSGDQAASVGLSAGAGTAVGAGLYLGNIGVSGLLSFGIGLGVAAGIFIATYKKQKTEIIKFECLPWEAPTGGRNCEVCNEDEQMPCSLYRCKSLGQACDIVNPGTEDELCVWIHPDDTSAPHLEVWEEALSEGLEYRPDNTISPPNHGFLLLEQPDGCMEPFTNFEFGIKTEGDPSQCRADFRLTETYSEMEFGFGDSLYSEEHRQIMKVPDPFNEEGDDANAIEEIHNNGRFTLYVRCRDANGNGEDSAAVAFTFCVKEGPDTRPPEIKGTNILEGSPVGFDQDTVEDVEVYTNEPAECRWSKQDKSFEAMENEMACASESYNLNAQLNYVCSGDLTGIKNREDNKFYFRCKDYSTAQGGRNVMTESYPLTLKGTEPLVIKEFAPEVGTEIKGSQSSVEVLFEVETAYGAKEGEATCKLSSTGGEESNFFEMDSTHSFEHSQTLYLAGGEHQYFIRCRDDGGNVDEVSTTFTVFVDTEKPLIARAYRDADKLKIITNEAAGCVYSLTSCDYDFEQATLDNPMLVEDVNSRMNHYISWDLSKTYYIKCEDLSDPPRRPAGNECTMIIQGSEF